MSMISGGGMSSQGPNWDMGGLYGAEGKKGSEKTEDTEHLDTIDNIDLNSDKTESASATSKKQEMMMKSSSSLEYMEDAAFSKARLKRTQDGLSGSSKLKQAMTKMKSGMKAFLKGFGSSGAKASVRESRRSGEGASFIPSDIPGRSGESAEVSFSMMDFYLDAAGMSRQEISRSEWSFQSIAGVTSLSPGGYINPAFNGDLEEGVAALSFQQVSTDPLASGEEKYASWTAARLGGEAAAKLLEPNAESASLVRRAPEISEKSQVDLVLLGAMAASANFKFTAFSDMARQAEGSLYEQMAVRGSQRNDIEESLDRAEAYDAARDIAEKNMQEQIENAKAQEKLQDKIEKLLLKSVPPGGLPIVSSGTAYASVSSGSSKFRIPKRSSNIEGVLGSDKGTYSKKLEGKKEDMGRHMSFHRPSPQQSVPIESSISSSTLPHCDRESVIASSSLSIQGKQELQNVYKEIPLGRPQEHAVSPSRGDIGRESGSSEALVSSSYYFSSFLGTSVQLAPPRDKEQYIRELEERPGRDGPPDPLIYQYRNVATNPPLILKPHTPYSEGGRTSVQGKPEASAAYNDGRGSGGGFGQGRDSKEDKGKKDSNDDEDESIDQSGLE